MPIIEKSTYKRPFYLPNKHLETVIPSLFRKIKGINYERERINTPDNDFLDLDWIFNDSKRLAIISHGLEGSADRHYVKGMAKHYVENGWDALGWNCRTCSGEMNKTAKFYHHGATYDLKTVVDHVVTAYDYEDIVMIGISMGGSLTLKYLGENTKIPSTVKVATVFSVPCHLNSSVRLLEHPGNGLYKKRFLGKLEKKVKAKAAIMPEQIQYDGFEAIATFTDFDNRYTAPLHGFEDAEDFYTKASARNYFDGITIPTLIVNAQNDPILSPECSPKELVENHPHIYLETPRHGGHVGFSMAFSRFNWAERRSLQFTQECLK